MILNWIIYICHRILASTWRLNAVPPTQPCTIGVWHEDIPTLLSVLSHQGMGAQVSRSQDGERLNFIFNRYGYTTFRGSSSQGFQSTRACLRFMQKGNSMTMALDGPRGPRGVAKPGTQWLSQQSQLPLYVVKCEYSQVWRLNSWDKMAWPKPFAKINLKFQPYSQLDAKFEIVKEEL